MRQGIHPEYNETTISCACGAAFKTRSTRSDYSVEICSNCHPFYTGKQKLVDTAGRIDKFNRKFKKVQSLKTKETQEKAAFEKPSETASTNETSKEPLAPR